jgi:biotin carboxylase
MGEENNYWIAEIYDDETANISVMSQEEAEAIKNMKDDFKEWQMAPVQEVDEEDMIERAEEHGYEHDPW